MIFGKNKAAHNETQTGIPRRETPASTQYQNVENTRILTLIAQDYLKERRFRRWVGTAFKLVILVYLGFLLFNYDGLFDEFDVGRHTALVELNGEIGPNGETAEQINFSLQRAFESESSIGVILNVNSPGGSPVHSARINDEIYRLKSLYPNKPVYVTMSDICASGCYYIAVAADQIYGHPASIVGSIGVLMDGFGFVESMKKLGVERRLLTAGENKAILDPFSPVNEEDQIHVKSMLDEIHQQFIDAVKLGRGNRLAQDDSIFSGLFWSGETARQLGLIDEFGTVEQVARDVVGAEQVLDYTVRPTWLDEFSQQVGVSIASGFFKNQFGLH